MSSSAILTNRIKLKIARGRRIREQAEAWDSEREDLLFFRGQTIAIVRHFFEIASQIGRLPSILGREFFRAKVTHHAVPSFEEQAVFVHDVERAIRQLSDADGEVVALVGLFQYSMEDVAKLLGCSRSWVAKRYVRSIDRLAERFLETGLLRDDRLDRRIRHIGYHQAPKRVQLAPKKPVQSACAYEVSAEAASYHFAAGPFKA